jgi:predicted Zn-dependent protease
LSAAACEAAVSLDPANLLARSYLSQAYANAGMWSDALRSVDALQKLSPAYPKSSLVRAYALLHLGRAAEALQSIGSELRRRAHPEAYLIRASACRMLRDEHGERTALADALKKIVESSQLYDYREACERLLELSKTDGERMELAGLIESLEHLDPQGKEFLEKELLMLRSAGTHQHPVEGSPAAGMQRRTAAKGRTM